jgi:N-acetylmuramoyl-L-alanine amidase
MTVLLDPGHGGADPGALGVAGTTGPNEADVNLTHAIAARDYLTNLGANAILTRTDDSALSLDDRLKLIEYYDADLFLSVQFNSVGENADANKIAGMEVYYHTPLSQGTANNMMGGLSANLNRNNRGVKTGVYRVTLLPYSPSLLLELGFLSNPLEYEKSTSGSEVSQTAVAIADGIQRAIA